MFCRYGDRRLSAGILRQAGPAQAQQNAEETSSPVCEINTNPPVNSGFPKGFDYPQTNIPAWVNSNRGPRMRIHGWCLAAGLNTRRPDGSFWWQGWSTSTQAFPYQYNPWLGSSGESLGHRPAPINTRNRLNAKVGGPNAINFAGPIYPINQALVKNPEYAPCREQLEVNGIQYGFQLKDGAHMQSNGDILIAGVIYNPAAASWIHNQKLYSAPALNARLPKKATDKPTRIQDFPSSAIVLKPMFWPVRKGGYTALPVWDWDDHKPGSPDDGQYAGYEMQKMWTRAVAITDLPTPPKTHRVELLHGVLDSGGQPLGPNTYANAQVVSVKRFYYRQYNQADLRKLSACDRALLDASAYWAYNDKFRPGDYVVLVAMHIITKEQPDWTLQSMWWHPDAGNTPPCRFCKHRPNLPPLNNYMLTTTYGTQQKPNKPNDYTPPGTKTSVWPVAYNPYIELAAGHPITTNCMNCHHRAAWPPQLQFDRPDKGRASAYIQPSPPNPNALEKFDPTDPVFNGLLTLDSMWAVSDRAGYPSLPAHRSSTPRKKKQ